MKRILLMSSIFALLLSLAACSPADQENTPMPNAEAFVETTEPTAETTAELTAFDSFIAIDNEFCTVTITALEPDAMWGYTVKAELENKSADTTYMFSVDSAAVNGVMSDPFFASEVAAGKKANVDISFDSAALAEYGIADITDIELSFRVYDSNDWEAAAVAEETFHIYPFGEENVTVFTRPIQDTDTVLMDNEYVTVLVTGYEIDPLWGYTANLFILNKTDVTLMVSVDEASVNGFMADPFYATSVIPGKCSFSSMSWSESTLEDNGITEVSEIAFVLRVYDYDDWSAPDFANEPIVLNP